MLWIYLAKAHWNAAGVTERAGCFKDRPFCGSFSWEPSSSVVPSCNTITAIDRGNDDLGMTLRLS